MRSLLKAIGVLPSAPTFGFWNVAIPLALKAGSALFKKRAGDKQGESVREANVAAGQLAADKAENTRLASQSLAAGMMPQMAGRGFMALDQNTMGKLGQRRDYSDLIEKAAGDPNAGSGSAFAAGLFGAGADVANDYFSGKEAGSSLGDLEASGITSQLSPEEEAWLRTMPEDA